MRSAVAIVVAVAALVAGAGIARAELRFTPCTEQGQEGFECATLRVPLDRSGKVPGTLRLRVQRLIQERQPAGTLINVEGGPGGSATWRSQQSARLFAPLRDRYQLVLVDPRGIGASRPYLRCSQRSARRCARQLGDAATFYTTADSVADLESVRQALGAPELFLYGTSYGTFVVSQYARTHPDHTERVVTDSPVAPEGLDPLGRDVFTAVEPMLGALCAGEACAAVTRHPAADTSALVRRLARRPLRARVVAPDGRARRVTLRADAVHDALLAADENVALRAFYPAAARSALNGDGAPLARLLLLGREHYTKRMLNPSIWVPTNCTDMRLPWPRSDDRAQRSAALVRAIRDVPERETWPLSPQILGDMAPGWSCIGWPKTSLARAVTDAPAPADVPVLVLSGQLDLRTSPGNARAMAGFFPRAQLMVVPNRAHGVLRTDVACGQQALLAFVDDRPVGNPCAATAPLLAIRPVAPRRLAAVAPMEGMRGRRARVLPAALDTVLDAVAVAQVAAPNGGAVRVGGLRGGTISGRRDPATGALRLRLDRVAHVRGVRVSGTVRGTADRLRGTFRVRAGRAGGRLGIDGEMWTFGERRAETTKGPRGGPFGTASAKRAG